MKMPSVDKICNIAGCVLICAFNFLYLNLKTTSVYLKDYFIKTATTTIFKPEIIITILTEMLM